MQNMSKVSNLLCLAAVSLAVISCGGSESGNTDEVAPVKCTIEGRITSAPSSKVVLQSFAIGQQGSLDTLATDAEGRFSHELDLMPGDPEMLYVHDGDEVFAFLLLEGGDKVSLTVDADGNAVISGSDESVKLTQLQKEHDDVVEKFAEMSAELESASSSRQQEIIRQMTEAYRDYNRSSVKYVMENISSLTSVPVLYRMIGDLPVFAMHTDAILFSNVADSLLATYPDSEVAKALKAESDLMKSSMEVAELVKNTEPIGYFDIELPSLDGKLKKLSDLNSKVILLYFWTAANPQQNVFNVDILKPLYEKYHDKGFDIYQVSLDSDKVMWATTVMGQNLPWTNVCDTKGFASEYASLYNLQILPSLFVISDGELIDGEVVDADSFEKLLKQLLK